MLYQLPTGDWVSLNDVVGIRAHRRRETCGMWFPDDVTVQTRTIGVVTVSCASWQEACDFRDELAGLVNDATESTSAT